jgi:hypothetical protein
VTCWTRLHNSRSEGSAALLALRIPPPPQTVSYWSTSTATSAAAAFSNNKLKEVSQLIGASDAADDGQLALLACAL